MLALQDGHAKVKDWLETVLDVVEVNAAHRAVAQLCLAGAHVWTVNFDRLIESSVTPPLPVAAWPAAPRDAGALLKPHGSLGGPLVFTSEDALRPLEGAWRARLLSDINASDVIVFVGYSGRDLDFLPQWDSLIGDRTVIWFDFADEVERTRKSSIFPAAARAGRLLFPDLEPNRSGRPNPSWDFVRWCKRHKLVSIPSEMSDEMLEPMTKRSWPVLDGNLRSSRAAVLATVGESSRARRTHLLNALLGPQRKSSILQALNLTADHGGRTVAAALFCIERLPEPLVSSEQHLVVRRKRASILFNRGRHDAVLKMTEGESRDEASTLRPLRAGSLRFRGDLDEAVREAASAVDAARAENHPARVANAALQHCYALMWAGRLDDARRALDGELRPLAGNAAARWVAWADLVEACLALYDLRTADAMSALDLATARFGAEGLVDGLVSTYCVKLVALRQARDDDQRQHQRAVLDQLLRRRVRGGRHLTRGSRFMAEAVMLEDAEYLMWCRNAPEQAASLLQQVVPSAYPFQSAIAHLGLAAASPTAAARTSHAATAIDIASRSGARVVQREAEARLKCADDPSAIREVFIP